MQCGLTANPLKATKIPKIPFNFLAEFLKAEWKKLKENFKCCIDKRARLTRSGAATDSLPKCKYFDQLLFIHDKVKNRETESNVNLGDSNEEQEQSSTESICTMQTNPSRSSTPTTKRANSDEMDGLYYTPTSAKTSKRNELSMQVDAMLVKSLNDLKEPAPIQPTIVDHTEDADTHFCKSIIELLKSFAPKQNRLAKMKIQQALFDIEFDSQ